MFTSTQQSPLVIRLRLSKRGKNAPSAFESSTPATTADDGPPVQRLTAGQIRLLSAEWKAKGRAGDDNALRVAEALEWVAERRASKEPKTLRTLAGRISTWMGLGEAARRTH